MGRIVARNQPCLDQINCCSSNARQVYEDGSSFCFSCNKFAPAEGVSKVEKHEKVKTSVEEIAKYAIRGFQDRKIAKATCEHYGVHVGYDPDGQICEHYYPYSNGGYKRRKLPKEFTWVGKSGGLFGKQLFNGGGKRLIITEGEIDALTIAQVTYNKYNKYYPVVSIPSASGTKELLAERDWIRSFGEVVLCLDNDEAGKKATDEAIRIIGIDKVRIWKPPRKDANEVLLKHDADTLLQCIWDAVAWAPAGIIKKDELWEALSKLNDTPSVPYPACLEGLNSKVKGMRLGEITLFISGTGAGKSTLLREINLHLLENTKTKIGIISLEESPGETARKLSGMKINRNPSNEEIPIADLKIGFDQVFGEDRVLLLDHQGSIKDASIVDQMEYMCLMGCEYIFVDHITILVSEGAEGLQGNEAIDLVMNHLLRLVKKHPVWIGLVSHLRKAQTGGKSFEEGRMPSIDDIRGSGSIKQISFDIVAFSRNMMASEETERNTIKMAVLKSRFTGLTGNVPGARYVNQTGRLVASEVMDEFDSF